MKQISSYPKIYNLGHRAVRDIFKTPTLIQEKVDGSQISFMRDGNSTFARSKKQMLSFENPGKMFTKGLEAIWQTAHQLTDGWVYRGEYLQSHKHNVLVYDRPPKNHIALYDIQVGEDDYAPPEVVTRVAEELGFDCVPYWELDMAPDRGELGELLNRVSFLGNSPREGIVIKNYQMTDPMTGKTLMAKYVSETFKEVHQRKTPRDHKDFIQTLVERHRTTARWQKAVMALREVGDLKESPEDIGQLIKYVSKDVHSECADEIKEVLFKHFWKQISRGIITGLPEWYKKKLLDKQFEEEE